MAPQLTAEVALRDHALEAPEATAASVSDAVLRQVLNAFVAMPRYEDPDRILDALVSTVLLVVSVPAVWAGWKCAGAPLGHSSLFDPSATVGEEPVLAPERLESALDEWATRLAPGQPPFEAEGLVVFPLASNTRTGALVVAAPLADLSGHLAVLGLLCDRAAAALELVAAQKAGRRAEALAETLTQLASSYSDPELVLQTIVRKTAELLDADATYVMLVDEAGTTLRVRTAFGITSGSFYEPTFAVDALLPGVAIRHRRVVCVRDLQAHEASKESRSEGLRTTMCAPMFVEDRLVGALFASHRTVRELSANDRRAMAALADAAAVSIVNARLYEEREGSIRNLAELNRLLAERSEASEHAIAFQQRLTSLILETGGGLEEIVRVAAETLGCQLLILDRELTVLNASGAVQLDPEPLDRLIDAARDGAGITNLEHEGRELLVAPLDLAGDRSAYVVMAWEAGDERDTEARMMAEAAVTAVGLELMRDRATAEAEARLTGGLFVTLMSDETVDEAALLRRASYLGYELGGSNAAIAVVADAKPGRQSLSLQTCVQRAVRRRREGPIAVFEHEDAIVVVLSDAAEVPEPLIAEYTAAIKQELDVSGRSGGARIAHAGPHLGIAGVRRAVREAQYALHVLGVLGRSGKPQAFDDLGVWTLLGRVGDAGQLMAFAEGVLGVLIAHDAERQSALVDTVRTLVECNFHYRTAAELLYTHPNTLRYRMSRINELTRLDFANADDRLKVEIALRILDVIGRPTE
jgi:DNA-binding PucR family transcriptional regulator